MKRIAKIFAYFLGGLTALFVLWVIGLAVLPYRYSAYLTSSSAEYREMVWRRYYGGQACDRKFKPSSDTLYNCMADVYGAPHLTAAQRRPAND